VDNFGIMLKSYGPDLKYAQRFLESFLQYSTEPIPLFVVVPDQDIPAFTEVFANHATVLPESLWADQLVDYPIHGNNPGYINQEIIKLAFAERGYLTNYLCADSEAVFIRPFSSLDFMDPSGVPYSFVTEDHELHVDPVYFDAYWTAREQFLMQIRKFLDLPTSPIATCHNMAVFSSEQVLLLKKYLLERGLDWAGALEISPYEFGWYNFWIEKAKGTARKIREPIVLMLHQPHQHLEYSLKGITENDLARGYVAVLINSGFAQDHGVIDFQEPVANTLSRYVSYRVLLGAAFERLFVRAPRVRSLLGKASKTRTS
jgi:hypothetical protein